MKRGMKWLTAVSFVLTVVFIGFTLSGCRWAISFAITFGTFFYHFAMRLLVGYGLNRVMNNRADYTKKWYRLRPFEEKLYGFLQVKKWKGRMPTYDPSLFDRRLHSWEEIAQAMCQAELVHEFIVVLSFLPLLAAIPFGSFFIFLTTSLLSAAFDLCFVIMQRFNRPRIIALIGRKAKALEKQKCSN